MKMKSAKEKARKGRKKRTDAISVKPECEVEQETVAEEDDYTNGDDLKILIKEEPHTLEISEHHSGDTSSYFETKFDSVKDGDDPHRRLKVECDSDQEPEYEFTDAAVKEESDSWLKEEHQSEEEVEEEVEDAEDEANIQEDSEEGEEICTGTSL